MQIRAVDPITIPLSNGERKFLLSMGGVRRLKERFGVKQLKDILNHDAEESGVPILYEALLDKQGMTEEQFADILPAHLDDVIKNVMRLLGASFPDPKEVPAPNLPTEINPAPTVQ